MNGKLVGTKNWLSTIAVIGSNGFIGSVLVRQLLEEGYSVLAVDNGFKPADNLLEFVYNNRFKYVHCDITHEESVKGLFEKHKSDGIILLAAIVGLDACENNRSLATAVNINGWHHVGYHSKGIPIVAASTGSIYGAITNGLCDEEKTVPNPLSHYGSTKYAGERHITHYGGVALRFATCAGVSPNMRLNLMPNQLVYEAIKNKVINVFEKNNLRTFVDIRDFANSLLYFLENFHNLKYNVYNVGSDKNNLTKGQLAELIKVKTGCLVNYVDTFKDKDARNYAVNYSRMKEAEFECFCSMEDTIDHLVMSIPLLNLESKYQ